MAIGPLSAVVGSGIGSVLLEVSVIGLGFEFLTQSWYLTVGTILLAITVFLSVLNGLIDIAFYVTLVGGIGLTIVGIVHWFAPDLIPFIVLHIASLPV